MSTFCMSVFKLRWVAKQAPHPKVEQNKKAPKPIAKRTGVAGKANPPVAAMIPMTARLTNLSSTKLIK